MTDPGLNHRLRQRSRRSGIMIGVSMLLTLAVCVASFTFIYAQLEPVVADFVGQGDIELPTALPTQPPPATEVPTQAAAAEPTAPAETGGDNQANADDGETEAEPTETPADDDGEFDPDVQIDSTQPINLRPGPGVSFGDAEFALPIGTPLERTGETEVTTDPARDQMDAGQNWVQVRTEDGVEGWVREFDLGEYVP